MYEPERSLQNNLFFWSSANFLTAFKFNALKEKLAQKSLHLIHIVVKLMYM